MKKMIESIEQIVIFSEKKLSAGKLKSWRQKLGAREIEIEARTGHETVFEGSVVLEFSDFAIL